MSATTPPAPTERRIWWLAATLLALTAYFSQGHHQSDEHYQILEFAAYKAGHTGASDLPWEFHERMRPALQPALAYGVLQTFDSIGLGSPFLIAFVLRLLSAAFTFAILRALWRRYGQWVEDARHRWLLLLLALHWCAYYNGVRFSSENWGGLFLVAGLLSYPLSARDTFTPAGGRSAWLAGACFGLAYLCRYQMGVAVAGFGLWALWFGRGRGCSVIRAVAGGLAVLIACYPLTYWLYGEWTLPAYNYLHANLVEGKAATYGTRPWWAYLELTVLRGIPPLGLVYAAAFFVFAYAYRRDPVSWMVVPFVLVHSVLARKDIRFLFPLIPVLPVLILGAARWLDVDGRRRAWRYFARVCWAVNLVLLTAIILRPAAQEVGPLRYIYRQYPNGVTLTGPDAPVIRAEGAVARWYLRPQTVVRPLIEPSCEPALPCLYVVQSRQAPTPPPGFRLVYTDRIVWLPVGVRWWWVFKRGTIRHGT